MKKTLPYSFIASIALCFSGLKAHPTNSSNVAYNKHIERAQQYLDAMLYAEASIEFTTAKEIALKNGLEREHITANISLAEIMRKTGDFSTGFEILNTIANSTKYPLLHVQKLGRIAALYSEAPLSQSIRQLDSVRFYLDSALIIAVQHDFKEEEAGLLNELGYLESRNSSYKIGRTYLLKSARIFKELGDEHNYLSAMTNVLKTYASTGQLAKFDSLANLLVLQLEGKKWYSAEVEIYNLLRDVRFAQGDSIAGYRYSNAAVHAHMSHSFTSNSNKMASFRVLYETDKIALQAKEAELVAARKSVALTQEIQRTFELKVFLSILGILMLIIGFTLLRERKLKRQLAVANEKYHMLIVESNHRIKNNLQMITSLIKYSEKGLDKNSKAALRKVSNKIGIISTLHKHLYVDVHNEYVNLRTYFQEILSLYEDISPIDFQVKNEIDRINIRSERIVYFGLFFNEMLSNSIEHSATDQLTVYVAVTPLKKGWLFVYRDSSNRSSDVAVGTGTLLIEQLINRVDGTHYRFDAATGQYQFEFHVES